MYESSGPTKIAHGSARRYEAGQVVKNAGFAQRNVFGGDLISIRWAKGAMGVVNNLTKNFFAICLFSGRGLLFGVRAGLPESGAISGNLACPRLGTPTLRPRSGLNVLDLYWHVVEVGRAGLLFFAPSDQHHAVRLHLVAIDVLNLWNDGITWRGTFYPLEELRKGMV